jgi:hypothetical protein
MREGVRAARVLGRQMIGAALVLPVLIGFLWIGAPAGIEPMLYEPPWYAGVVPLVAAGLYLIGLAWMIRINRTSHLEPETSSWRYRDQAQGIERERRPEVPLSTIDPRNRTTYFGSIPQSTKYSLSLGVFVIWTRSVPSIFIV